MQLAFFILLTPAIAALIGGQLWARLNWRPDTHPYGLHTNPVDVMVHPDRYVRAHSVRTVRFWSGVGLMLLMAAASVLVYVLASLTLQVGSTTDRGVTSQG